MRTFTVLSVGLVLILGAVPAAHGLPTDVVSVDAPNCDPLVVPDFVHELGIAPAFKTFPDELIEAVSTTTFNAACPASDNPSAPNALVVMTNLTTTAWREVWYVADPEVTTISNYDGYADAAGAPLFYGICLAARGLSS